MSHLNPRAPTPHGFTAYSRCARCGTERPETALAHSAADSTRYLAWLKDGGAEPVLAAPVCVDVAWCGRQVGFRGELTGTET
jgi:hypothetical protein